MMRVSVIYVFSIHPTKARNPKDLNTIHCTHGSIIISFTSLFFQTYVLQNVICFPSPPLSKVTEELSPEEGKAAHFIITTSKLNVLPLKNKKFLLKYWMYIECSMKRETTPKTECINVYILCWIEFHTSAKVSRKSTFMDYILIKVKRNQQQKYNGKQILNILQWLQFLTDSLILFTHFHITCVRSSLILTMFSFCLLLYCTQT